MKKIATWLALVSMVSTAWTIKGCNISEAKSVQFRWTAPGDDCAVGTAANYQVIRSTDSATIARVIATDVAGGTCNDGGKIGVAKLTIDAQIPGLLWSSTLEGTWKTPAIAGTAELQTIDLAQGKWFLIIRSIDDAQNISAWSAICVVEIDEAGPRKVGDFR